MTVIRQICEAFEKAERFLEKYSALQYQMKAFIMYINSLICYGVLNLEKGDSKKALGYFNEAFALRKKFLVPKITFDHIYPYNASALLTDYAIEQNNKKYCRISLRKTKS